MMAASLVRFSGEPDWPANPAFAAVRVRTSERASATITLSGKGPVRSWHLDGMAHAEVGTRP